MKRSQNYANDWALSDDTCVPFYMRCGSAQPLQGWGTWFAPQVGAGACCNGCAQGGSCEARVGGPFDAERAIPWTQVAEFDAIAKQFMTEVNAWTSSTTLELSKIMPYKLKFDQWAIGWNVWFASTAEPGFFDLSFLGIKILRGEKLLEFDAQRSTYEELRREAITLGAPITAPEPPKDKNVQIAEGVKSGTEGFLDTTATIAKYATIGLVIAGVGYAAIALAPALAATVVRRRATR